MHSGWLHNGYTIDYMKWLPNQPDNRNQMEDCIKFVMGKNFTGADDVICECKEPFTICQMESKMK
ncbi:uncharacterized protein Dwil_GK26928 [Drosophila willistoni]|uniref:C-type lectin domain-containing protein n=1 Tax=Drosophila willistoni TaxID=7260 RepID=A0A0Q9WQK2_DROWI|nr:uncharacterized protein Dwil_GK26928 [Drosophila willistoni]